MEVGTKHLYECVSRCRASVPWNAFCALAVIWGSITTLCHPHLCSCSFDRSREWFSEQKPLSPGPLGECASQSQGPEAMGTFLPHWLGQSHLQWQLKNSTVTVARLLPKHE